MTNLRNFASKCWFFTQSQVELLLLHKMDGVRKNFTVNLSTVSLNNINNKVLLDYIFCAAIAFLFTFVWKINIVDLCWTCQPKHQLLDYKFFLTKTKGKVHPWFSGNFQLISNQRMNAKRFFFFWKHRLYRVSDLTQLSMRNSKWNGFKLKLSVIKPSSL